jgi:hypothetical protein
MEQASGRRGSAAFVLAMLAVLAFAACGTPMTPPTPLSLACHARAGNRKEDLGLQAVLGARAQTTLPVVSRVAGHDSMIEYSVRFTVLKVDPDVRVRVDLSIATDSSSGTRHVEGDLAPVFFGVIRPPAQYASRVSVTYECFPPA